MRRLLRPSDQRAQAGGFIVLFLILAVGALLWGLLDAAAQPIFADLLGLTSNPDAVGKIEERQTIWNNVLFAVLGLGTLFIFARAVRQSNT